MVYPKLKTRAVFRKRSIISGQHSASIWVSGSTSVGIPPYSCRGTEELRGGAHGILGGRAVLSSEKCVARPGKAEQSEAGGWDGPAQVHGSTCVCR